MELNDWKRPASVPYPTVWRRFNGLKPMPDGRIPEFWVQDATDSEADAVAYNMTHYFSRDEEMSKAINFYDEGSAMNSNPFFKAMVGLKMTLAAMTDWPDGKPKVVGCNVLYVFRKGDKLPDLGNKKIKKFQSVMFYTLNLVDVYERFGVDEFSTAIGLSVSPEFRGHNIGVELLKARAQLTRAVGLKLTLNNFTGIASQKQAARAGYELLAEVPYTDITDDEGRPLFPNIACPTLQFRAMYVGD